MGKESSSASYSGAEHVVLTMPDARVAQPVATNQELLQRKQQQAAVEAALLERLSAQNAPAKEHHNFKYRKVE